MLNRIEYSIFLPLCERIVTAIKRTGIPMAELDNNELVNEALYKYGLPVKLVMESFHTPSIGVIKALKGW